MDSLPEDTDVTIQDISKEFSPEELKNPKNAIYHIIHCVTQGPLGADRLDFTKRDSFCDKH